MIGTLLQGCYYWQAVQGQAALSRARVPVAEVIADPQTPPPLKSKLELSQRALTFAHDALGLPDNGSYRHYVDLGRDYVVVNVFAAPEFSLAPKTWCYPFVGCLAYRGYFARNDAERYAARLAGRGFDVSLSPVPAYSTLGKLRDPLLSTMLRGSDAALVSLIFHELAHQRVYADDDTAFNESFATAVAAEGLSRWRAREALPRAADSDKRHARRAVLMQLLAAARADLQAIYDADIDDTTRRARKAARFDRLAAAWLDAGGRPPAPDNNAALVPLNLYHDRSDAFLRLLARCDGDLACWYADVERLAELPAAERDAALARAAAGQSAPR